MARIVALLLVLVAALQAANLRLYLKDGDYQAVREYKVEGDRVRYLSADRNEWEEIPLDLIDLKKTEREAGERAAAVAEVARLEKEEDDAIRADRRLVASVPEAVGPYLVEGSALRALAESEVTIDDSKARKILQVLSPAPIIPGKLTVTIAGKASKVRLTGNAPEFFFRLAEEERFAIIKLTPKKDERVVEVVTILPNDQGTFEDQKQVAVFKKQYGVRLHKVWGEQVLEPGEYAVVEYTEGKVNVRVWDFAVDKQLTSGRPRAESVPR